MPSLNELAAVRQFFDTGTTTSYAFRIQQLQRLKAVLEKYEEKIYQALY